MKTLLLSQEDVKSLVNMRDFVEICDKTYQDMGRGAVVNPAKLILDLGESTPYPPYNGFFNAMPAYIGWLDICGIKWAGGFMNDKRKLLGLPYVNSLIMLADPQLGLFKAVLDGAYITTMRTGAQTAAALKYLWKKRSVKVGLFGAGAQGRTQIMAIAELFDIERLIVYDIVREAAETFKGDIAHAVKGDIILAEHPKQAAEGDVIITVTQSTSPILKKEWVKPGTIVFPMGSYQEAEDELILSADKVIVDHVEQCLHRGALAKLAHDGAITEDSLYGTIGEIACGAKAPGDLSQEIVVVVPIGTGALDIAVAGFAYFKATEREIGQHYEFVRYE